MKRITILIIDILLCVGIFVSCSKGDDKDRNSTGNDYFVYPMERILTEFDVDDTGNLFYYAWEDTGGADSSTDINGETFESPTIETKLYSVDSKGNMLKTYILGEGAVNGLKIDQNKAYYTTVSIIGDDAAEEKINDNEGNIEPATIITFYEYSLDNQNLKELYQIEDLDRISKFEIINDQIYYLGIDNDRSNKEYTLADDEDNYYYSGEVLCVIDTVNGTMEELPVDFPVEFAKTLNNSLLIYAHDGEGGYYFTEYNSTNGSLSEKVYHNLEKLSAFDVYNEKNDIIFNSINTSVISLAASPIKANQGITELMPYVGTSRIVCQGDYTYYANSKNSNRIERIRNSSYIRGENVIHMLSAEFAPYTPFGCGYTFDREYLDAESFALTVLSQDDSYDVCLMSSRQNISENIRNKGSFYPLNEVDGVSEYLDACFPYIKEAAVTEDGDVWMLPISVDIPCLLYNEALCKSNDIDLTVPTKMETFIGSLSAIQEDSALKDSFMISLYMLSENIFYQYLQSYEDFDNEYFRELAPYLKEKLNYEKGNGVIGNIEVWEILRTGNLENFLFDLEYYFDSEARYSKTNAIRVSGLPKIAEKKTNIATCLYLCVNPSSENLKATLKYISSLCNYMLSQNETMLLKDRELYPDNQAFDDLYDIYSNGMIVFTLPDELYMNDYAKYLRDEIDLETFIIEADRKLDTFRKE